MDPPNEPEDDHLLTICPHCGLVLRMEARTDDLALTYDVDEWRRRCNYLSLGSPALCVTLDTIHGGK